MSSAGPELEPYFARIRYQGPRAPTLEVLHAITSAHSQTIPFENLDVLLGRRIYLETGAIFEKLVHERRGGYCFEQNGLLLYVLERLGFRVTPLSGRVRLQRTRDEIPPRTHLFLRVDLAGETWLTDVGIGGLSQTAAIRLHMDGAQSTPHETRRIVREGSLWFHQVLFANEWKDVVEFTGEQMPAIDRELANWYTSAHPDSPFQSKLQVARAASGGRRVTLLNDELSLRDAAGNADKLAISSPEQLLSILGERFGLHFPAGTRFGGANRPWPT